MAGKACINGEVSGFSHVGRTRFLNQLLIPYANHKPNAKAVKMRLDIMRILTQRPNRLDYYIALAVIVSVLLIGGRTMHNATAQTGEPGVITVREVRIVDASGTERATLGMSEGRPEISMNGPDTLTSLGPDGMYFQTQKAPCHQFATYSITGVSLVGSKSVHPEIQIVAADTKGFIRIATSKGKTVSHIP